MNFRTTFAALLLTAAPITSAAAQVEWRISTFANTAAGFAGALQFRNTQGFSDAPIVGITNVTLSASALAQASCAPNLVACSGWGLAGASTTVGSEVIYFSHDLVTPGRQPVELRRDARAS